MMDEQYGRVDPEMDVCDINGEKIGTVAHVYHHEYASAGATSEGMTERAEIIEVKSGFLGLGKRLFVPMTAVHDVTNGAVFLSRPRESIDEVGWETKPADLSEWE